MPLQRRPFLALGTAALAAPLLPGARAQTQTQTQTQTQAKSQAAWPDRPVRFIVPYPAGSTPDIVARSLVPHLTQVFGQPFVVDNRSGAGGNLGTDQVAKATDGHTLGVSINGPLSTAPALYPNLPYDPARDLIPVSLLVRAGQVLVVHPDVPARNLAEFVAYAKSNPGRMNFGSVGPGSGGHLAMEDIKARAGIALEHVPYRGFPPAVLDLVAGRIQAMVLTVGAILPQLREGQARALAVTADARLPQLPEVPTMAEAGLPDATSYGWNAMIAPAGTPPERIARLAEAAREALSTPEARQAMDTLGFEVVAGPPRAAASWVREEAERWGGMIRRLGIKAD